MIAVGAVGRIGLIGSGDRGSPEGWPTWADLPNGSPINSWDMLTNEAWFDYKYRGALANTPGWSFTRASTGYAQTSAGALTAFASGELRRTDKGVLIEGARTNLCLQSQTFDNAAWTKDNGATVADQTVAPDGTTTADTFVPTAISAQHRFIASNVTVTSAATYAMSYYVKPNGYTKVAIREGVGTGAYAAFSLSGAGSVLDAGTGTGSVEALANGWYRITLVSAASGTTFRGDLWVLDPSYTSGIVTGSWTANGTSGIYAWGAQLELGAFPSSYIPTTTASATRATDVLTVPVSGIDYPLSLFAEFERAVATAGNEWLLQIDDGSANNRAAIRVNGTPTASSITVATTQQSGETVAGSLALSTTYKEALRVTTNDIKLARGGTLSSGDTAATNPATPTTIRFGKDTGTGVEPFGYLRRAAIWTRALSDAELQAVTL